MKTTFIILAAGEGSRLRPLTNEVPKCMVPVGSGTPLLDLQVNTAHACGIKDIIVVRGYLGDRITRSDVTFCDNREYRTTNMVESLWCAERYFNEDVIISYGDIIYEASVLRQLLESGSQVSVVVDYGWRDYWEKRSDNPVADAESLKIGTDGNLMSIGQPIESICEPEAQYIGLMRFRGSGVNHLRHHYLKAVSGAADERDRSKKRNIYMTDLLQNMINSGVPLTPVGVQRKWLEIDTVRDLEIANAAVVVDEDGLRIRDLPFPNKSNGLMK